MLELFQMEAHHLWYFDEVLNIMLYYMYWNNELQEPLSTISSMPYWIVNCDYYNTIMLDHLIFLKEF